MEVPWVVVMLRLGRHCVKISSIIVVWAAEVLYIKSPNGDNQPHKGRKSRKGKLVLIGESPFVSLLETDNQSQVPLVRREGKLTNLRSGIKGQSSILSKSKLEWWRRKIGLVKK